MSDPYKFDDFVLDLTSSLAKNVTNSTVTQLKPNVLKVTATGVPGILLKAGFVWGVFKIVTFSILLVQGLIVLY
jgi:hypothetical protein